MDYFTKRQFEAMKRYNLRTDLDSMLKWNEEAVNAGFTSIEDYLDHKLGPKREAKMKEQRLRDVMAKYNLKTDLFNVIRIEEESINAGYTDVEEYLKHKLGPVKVPSTPVKKIEPKPAAQNYKPAAHSANSNYKPAAHEKVYKKEYCHCGGYKVLRTWTDMFGVCLPKSYYECNLCGNFLRSVEKES